MCSLFFHPLRCPVDLALPRSLDLVFQQHGLISVSVSSFNGESVEPHLSERTLPIEGAHTNRNEAVLLENKI